MNPIIDNILNDFGITSSIAKEKFKNKATIKSYSKLNDIFVQDKRNDFEYILISGILNRYILSEKGDMITTGFYMSKAVITPHFARTNQGKSIFNLQSLTNSVLVEISVNDLNHLRHNHKEFNAFGQRIVEAELSQIHFNDVVFRSYSAKERLLMLREQFQNLENTIPHHIIASYLGITPVSFSRLRNELTK